MNEFKNKNEEADSYPTNKSKWKQRRCEAAENMILELLSHEGEEN